MKDAFEELIHGLDPAEDFRQEHVSTETLKTKWQGWHGLKKREQESQGLWDNHEGYTVSIMRIIDNNLIFFWNIFAWCWIPGWRFLMWCYSRVLLAGLVLLIFFFSLWFSNIGETGFCLLPFSWGFFSNSYLCFSTCVASLVFPFILKKYCRLLSFLDLWFGSFCSHNSWPVFLHIYHLPNFLFCTSRLSWTRELEHGLFLMSSCMLGSMWTCVLFCFFLLCVFVTDYTVGTSLPSCELNVC